MKPKRRVTLPISTSRRGFSPQSASPRVKRRRTAASPSPVRRKSSSGRESVHPPPEFTPFDYENNCPKLMELLKNDIDSHPLLKEDLLNLQYDLESMLAHAADYSCRAQRELSFLNTGDYPTEDLRSRPMPSYKLREEPVISPTSPAENEPNGICGLPVDETEDDIDVWPPHHIPTRFWTWCKRDFMEPINSAYLKEFKALVMDPCTPEALEQYYVNEPWKYRKRNGKLRTTPDSGGRGRKRRSSCEEPPKKREGEKSKEGEKEIRRSSRSGRERIPSLIGNVVNAVCREMKKEGGDGGFLSPASLTLTSPPSASMTTPSRRHSGRLQSREDQQQEVDRKLSIKVEPPDSMDISNGLEPEMVSPASVHSVAGSRKVSHSPRGLTSPRVKKEPREEGEGDEMFDWAGPGPSGTSNNGGPSTSHNGKGCNGDTARRRNGESKRVNGLHCQWENGHSTTPSSSSNNKGGSSEEAEMEEENIEEFRSYKDIGEKILTHLIEKGLVPEYASHVYGHMSKSEADVEISTEGREPTDDDQLDEVSLELLRCQQELKELEPDLRGITEHCWQKLRTDFAFWETATQLDDADYDLFRLGVNMYKEVPRRQPTAAEWPTLRTGVIRRNKKARAHYGPLYKRQPNYYEVEQGQE